MMRAKRLEGEERPAHNATRDIDTHHVSRLPPTVRCEAICEGTYATHTMSVYFHLHAGCEGTYVTHTTSVYFHLQCGVKRGVRGRTC
jgi:hypothetical protein